MAVRHGYGKVVTDGLVFAYDTGDTVNSYKGEPTENLIGNFVNQYNTDYWVRATNYYQLEATNYVVQDKNAPGGAYTHATGNTSNTNAQIFWSAGNSICNEFGQQVAVSAWLRGSGTVKLIAYDDTAGYQSGPAITLTDEWTYHKHSTTFGSGGSQNSHWVGVREITTGEYVHVAQMQWERKSHATPYVKGTRSVSGSLLDLTGTNELDVTNVTYDSDAHFKLSGSHYLQLDSGDTFNFGTDDFTIEVVFNMEYNTSYNHFFNIKDQYHFALKQNRNNYPTNPNRIYVYRTSGLNSYNSIVIDATPGTTNHLICQRKGDNIEMYLNGEYKGSKSGWGSIDIQGDTYDTFIGKQSNEYSKGYQYVTKVYNRALTAGEVKQNFAVYKNRFNI